jgi:hypothetical protein
MIVRFQAVSGLLEHISVAVSMCETVVEQCSSFSPPQSYIGRTNDQEHGCSRENPHCWRVVPSNKYVKTLQTGKTWNVL